MPCPDGVCGASGQYRYVSYMLHVNLLTFWLYWKKIIVYRIMVELNSFLWRQRSRTPLRNHFVGRPSVCQSVCDSLFAYNFFTLRDRAFIFGMCVPNYKTFPIISSILSTWPWPWPLRYICKTLTLYMTFLPLDTGLSYCASVFF